MRLTAPSCQLNRKGLTVYEILCSFSFATGISLGPVFLLGLSAFAMVAACASRAVFFRNKEISGSNSSDGGNTRDGVKITGGVIESCGEIEPGFELIDQEQIEMGSFLFVRLEMELLGFKASTSLLITDLCLLRIIWNEYLGSYGADNVSQLIKKEDVGDENDMRVTWPLFIS
ncbi:hypothetical protein Tco_0559559 [Tanacetum coccineum]